jgi:predicted ribosome quality control (RQC) complex YloA/Tae2 family protein
MASVFDGISTQTAEEILHRAGIAAEFTADFTPKRTERLAAAMKRFLEEAVSSPHPCVQFNGDGLPVFYSCVPYGLYPEASRQYFDDCNAALDFYYAKRAGLFRLAQQRDALAKTIGKLLDKLERRIHIYQASIDDAQRAGKVQRRADMITANLYRLKKGMGHFEAADYETGAPVRVELDVSMTPQELAQKLYKKIAKYKKAAAMNTQKLIDARDEQEFLLGALHYTEQARSTQDVAEIRQSLTAAGYLAAPPKAKQAQDAASSPLRFTSPSGYEIWVGKNDRQNDVLTLRTAAKDDVWFHAQKIPGSHVLLVTNGAPLNDIDDDTIVYAASLAAAHSRAQQSGKTAVDYTQRKNIKRPPGARPGKVTYDDYFTVYVEPADPRE